MEHEKKAKTAPAGKNAEKKLDLSFVSLNQLEQLTGREHRTLKKRLEGIQQVDTGGQFKKWPSKIALAKIYDAEREPDEINGNQQKARLTKAQADMAELELAAMNGQYVKLEMLEAEWASIVSNIRARFLSMPSKLAPRLSGISDARLVEDELINEVYEILGELSKYEPRGNTAAGASEFNDADDETLLAATTADN